MPVSRVSFCVMPFYDGEKTKLLWEKLSIICSLMSNRQFPGPALIITRCSPTDTELSRVVEDWPNVFAKTFPSLIFELLQSFLQHFENQRVTLSMESDQLANHPRESTSLHCLFCGSSLCCFDKWSTTWAGKIFGPSTLVHWFESQRRNSQLTVTFT